MPRLRQAGAKLPPTLAFSLRHLVSHSPLSFHIWNIITILRGHPPRKKDLAASWIVCSISTSSWYRTNHVIQEFATWRHSFQRYILAGPRSRAQCLKHVPNRSPTRLKDPHISTTSDFPHSKSSNLGSGSIPLREFGEFRSISLTCSMPTCLPTLTPLSSACQISGYH